MNKGKTPVGETPFTPFINNLSSAQLGTTSDDQLFYFISYVFIWFSIIHHLLEAGLAGIFDYYANVKFNLN